MISNRLLFICIDGKKTPKIKEATLWNAILYYRQCFRNHTVDDISKKYCIVLVFLNNSWFVWHMYALILFFLHRKKSCISRLLQYLISCKLHTLDTYIPGLQWLGIRDHHHYTGGRLHQQEPRGYSGGHPRGHRWIGRWAARLLVGQWPLQYHLPRRLHLHQ